MIDATDAKRSSLYALEIAKLREQVETLEARLHDLTRPPPEEMRILREHGISLPPVQRRIFAYLAKRAGQQCSVWQLLNIAYGDKYADMPNPGTIRVNISHLRKRIAPLGYAITCEWGEGYRLERTQQ